MAQTLPSPPSSRAETPIDLSDETDNEEQLMVRLDDLLARYLEQLDQYTKLRERLSVQFSDGFFALARAQRASNMGAGRRYGQDGYDGRMKATRRMEITEEAGENARDTKLSYKCSKYEHARDNLERQSSKSVNNKIKDEPDNSTRKESRIAGEDQPKLEAAYRDPATWYGLLVPISLRQAQSHFDRAVEETVPGILDVQASLVNLEHEILHQRALLGTNSGNSIRDAV